jgi:hypothetical protein
MDAMMLDSLILDPLSVEWATGKALSYIIPFQLNEEFIAVSRE